MKKQNLMLLALMGITTALTVGAEADELKCEKTAMNNMDCSNLTPAEKDFASKLNDKNKKMFCQKFSASQRKSAMMASCNGPASCGQNRGSGKKVMSPNDSVMKVAKDNKISLADEMGEKRENLSAPQQ